MLLRRAALSLWALASTDPDRSSLQDIIISPDGEAVASNGVVAAMLAMEPTEGILDPPRRSDGLSEPSLPMRIPATVARRAIADVYKPVAKKKKRQAMEHAVLKVSSTHGYLFTERGDGSSVVHEFKLNPDPCFAFSDLMPKAAAEKPGLRVIAFDARQMDLTWRFIASTGVIGQPAATKIEMIDAVTAITVSWSFPLGKGLLLAMPIRLPMA